MEQCVTHGGSAVRGMFGDGIELLNSVETFRGTDLWHGQIGVGPTGQTRFVATPGGRASWGMRAPHASPRRAAGLGNAIAFVRFASLPAATHGLRATCATTSPGIDGQGHRRDGS